MSCDPKDLFQNQSEMTIEKLKEMMEGEIPDKYPDGWNRKPINSHKGFTHKQGPLKIGSYKFKSRKNK